MGGPGGLPEAERFLEICGLNQALWVINFDYFFIDIYPYYMCQKCFQKQYL